MSVVRDLLFERHRNQVYKHKNLRSLSEEFPIYADYVGGWMEKDFKAIKCRETIAPDFYTCRNIHMPETFDFNEIFTSVRLTSGEAKSGEYFLGTRCDGLLDGWQEQKFMKFYVKPCSELIEIQARVMGYGFSAFELIHRTDGTYLITASNKTDIGTMSGMWVALIYDIPESLKVSK